MLFTSLTGSTRKCCMSTLQKEMPEQERAENATLQLNTKMQGKIKKGKNMDNKRVVYQLKLIQGLWKKPKQKYVTAKCIHS